eukprot:TRINITY_DN8142_c0_g1_i1.p1 TRINITY_DN8142_c0_g1~~TRINITY_DN8142_c0_g1_i1.p1  ORF type:complete len:1558 (+),score=509.63 TRINITY_DN8142_c0_g1_i1:44-4675(+)
MSQSIRAGDLPPVSQMFGAQGVGGAVPTVDIEEVFDRHEEPVPVGTKLRHELRIPLEDEGRDIMKNALNAYPETPTPENITIPCIEVLKPYLPGKDYRPTNSAAFKTAKDRLQASIKDLPAYQQRGDIMQSVKANQITIVSGPAGSGKSTHVPQLMLDMAQFTKKRILQVSSSSLSVVSTVNKVAADLGVDVGSDIVGYALRLEANIKRSSQLMCTTPGMTLRMLQTDKDLSDIGCVIIDEWELCDMEKELLFCLLKALLKRNEAFRVVVCCDDADGSEAAGSLFRACTETHSTARVQLDAINVNHEVPCYYLEEAISYGKEPTDNVHAVSLVEGAEAQAQPLNSAQNWRLCEWKEKQMSIIMDVLAAHMKVNSRLTGKVVIFLPSWGHMQMLADELEHRNILPSSTPIIPVHENTLPEMIHGKAVLSAIFSSGGAVLLTTTSMVNELPITDVELVLDSCHHLPYAYHYKVGMHCGDILPVSKLELFKRSLLMKRSTIKNSACFHLIPRSQEANLAPNPEPLVHGTDLRASILLLKAISDKFDVKGIFSTTSQPPEPEAVDQAIDLLKQAALLNKDGGISPLGLFCAYLPVDFTIAKMMYYGVSMRCLDPTLTIAASLLAPPLFSSSAESIEHTVESKNLFSQESESDLLAGLHAYLTLEQIDDKSAKEAAFCKHNNLNLRSMHAVRRLRGILLDLLLEVNFFRSQNWTEANKNMKATTVIKSCVAAGLYPNLVMHSGVGAAAKLAPTTRLHQTEAVPTLMLHPNAVGRFRKNPMAAFMVYSTAFYTTEEDGSRTGVVYGATTVEPLSIVLFSGAGAGTKVAEANAGTTGKCRGWYDPDITMAWAKNERAAYFMNEARKARDRNAPPDNNLPVPFTNAVYTEDSKIEVCLDQQVRLVADKSMAELAVKIRKALAAVTSQRVISLSTPHIHSMSPGLFPEQLIEMLKLLLTRCANPAATEHKLRAKFWGLRGPYVSKLQPVFTYVASMGAPPPIPGMPPTMPPYMPMPPGYPPGSYIGPNQSPPPPPGMPGVAPLQPFIQQPSTAEKALIDHLAQKVFASGSREMEQKLKAKNLGNPAFNFLNVGHPFNAYYENKLKQLAETADKPAVASMNEAEQARAEARRRYLQEQGILQEQQQPPLPQVPIVHGGGVDVAFVPKRDLPQQPPPQMQPDLQFGNIQSRPGMDQLPRTSQHLQYHDLPPTQHLQPPLPPDMPPGMPLMAPMPPGPPPAPAKPRVVRRPTTPKKKIISEDKLRPKSEEELARLSTEEILKLEKERLKYEIEQNSEVSGLGDNITPVGPPPPILMPSRPSHKGMGLMGQPVGPGQGMVMSMDKGANMPAVKKPSVLVGPIPAKSETKGSNLPLILAKALGETLGVRVGPTLIVGHEARIDVPSYGIEEKALKKEFFVCLGKKIGIHKNDKIQAPEKSFLAARLDVLRKKVSAGYNLKRGRSVDSDEKPRLKDRPKRRRSNSRGGRNRRQRSVSDERLAIEGGPRRRRDSPPPSRPKREPTPEKPKAAKTPPSTYKCPRCKAVGEHWVKDCTGGK